MTEHIQTRMSSVQYRTLPETTQPTELINGMLIVSPSPFHKHQKLVSRLYKLIDRLASSGEVMFALMDVEFDAENVTQPDVFWVKPGGRCVLRDEYFYGPPDLIVEVLSVSTAKRDRREKFALYQAHGVAEYWLADPDGKLLEVFVWQAGRFVRQGAYGASDTFDSPILGQSVALASVFDL